MSKLPSGRLSAIGEISLFGVLVISWVGAYQAAQSSLEELPAGFRILELGMYETDHRLWVALVLGVVGAVQLLLRRWYPFGALVAIAATVLALEWGFPYLTRIQLAPQIMLVVAVFTALRHTNRFIPLALISAAVGVLVSVPSYRINRNLSANIVAAPATDLADLTSVVATMQWVLLVAVAVATAALVRRLDAQTAELADRNRELEERRALAAQAAVLDERVRISRELHDVVAHHVTTMTVHAGAARQIAGIDPDATTESLRQIETSGRSAITELQRLLGFLRSSPNDAGDDDDIRAPVPSLRYLSELTSSVRPELECSVSIEGEPTTVPQSVDVSAYRIIQEALTNVMKHSTTTNADVDVRVGDDRVEISVRDRGPAARPSPPGAGGHGLVGMRERATLHGGSVQTGPEPDGGWLVVAALPYDGSGR